MNGLRITLIKVPFSLLLFCIIFHRFLVSLSSVHYHSPTFLTLPGYIIYICQYFPLSEHFVVYIGLDYSPNPSPPPFHVFFPSLVDFTSQKVIDQFC